MPKSLIRKVVELFKPNFPTLDEGDIDPLVLGTQYSQSLLRTLYRRTGGKKTILTLTPICEYQIKKKWPTPPFVNINLPNSHVTERSNWLGFIPIDGPLDIDFEEIIKQKGNVNIYASIHRTKNEYWIQLFVNDKYKYSKDRLVKTFISHDKNQIKLLTDISYEIGRDHIKVSLEKSLGKYICKYNGRAVGTASCSKIENCIGDNIINTSFLSIKKFRFDDEPKEKHYSPLTIII